MSTILETKSSKLLENPGEKRSGGDVGPRSASEKLRPVLLIVGSGEMLSTRQTSIDKTNDCVMNSERSALVRGSDPP